jgi:hypothetical protein
VGDYIEIDTDMTRKSECGSPFNNDVVREASSITPINNNTISLPSISQNQVNTIIGQINSAINSDERNRYTAEIEANPRNGNIIYRFSGERK